MPSLMPPSAFTAYLNQHTEGHDLSTPPTAEPLEEALRVFETVMDAAGNAMFFTDPTGHIILCNQRCADWLGQPLLALRTQPLGAVLGEGGAELHAQVLRSAAQHASISTTELYVAVVEGDWHNVNFNTLPVMLGGRVLGVVGAVEDVSARRRNEALLAGEEMVLELLSREAPLVEIVTRIVEMVEAQCGEALCAVFTVDDANERLTYLAAPHLPMDYVNDFDRITISTAPGSFSSAALHRETVWVRDIALDAQWAGRFAEQALSYGLRACGVLPLVSVTEPQTLGVMCSFYRTPRVPSRDEMTLMQRAGHLIRIAIEHKQARANILRFGQHDLLTGLVNGAAFREGLRQALQRIFQGKRMVAVILLGLDRFKLINDTLGHEAGDQLLRVIAERLKAVLRSPDTIARLGGDEFGVILQDVVAVQDVATVVHKILHEVGIAMTLFDQEVFTSASIGVALAPLDGATVDNLLRNADAAMSKVKQEGRNGYRFYAADMNAMTLRQLSFENGLRHALERDEFVLHYQPKVDLKTGKVVGMEALLRWQHPENGLIPPLDFISTLEETGLILQVGAWVLRTACRQLQAWRNMGLKGLRVAVNLSARQFQQDDLVAQVQHILHETGVAPEHLELEITESMVMQSPERAVQTLQEFRDMGIHVSMDDFGTGYSSLGYLRRFPLGSVKIDRAFIREIPTNTDDAAITTAIIAMAHSLRLRVVAEGVEEHGQVLFLQAYLCDEMQGYFFSKPLTVAAFEQLLREGRCMEIQATNSVVAPTYSI